MTPCMLISILSIVLLRTASGCLFHEDCAFKESLCFDAYCVEASELSMDCTTSENCRTENATKQNAGRACKDNKCYEILADKLCATHLSCDDTHVCLRNHCVPSVATSMPCFVDLLCGTGRRCLGGICYRPREISKKEDAPP
ncbi:hypothetical protein M514_13808 [Trichuris suis]|uniref:DUF7107 domain-containing protein n=1 Tax=Trichuris suis TaxID=68888 RepID=A0A085LK20_9BILA|nr:hypothetical protein M513_13808 [Trichuris suis]KFD72331.1 hypothetical protein M514_13808 [Trichuris suis]KHJ49293.1 hypothetical protein D918_00418 [Trichuris suis]